MFSKQSKNQHIFYPVVQWFSIMLYGENRFKKNRVCEYCNEEFMMFEKIIYPQKCRFHKINSKENDKEDKIRNSYDLKRA